MKTSSSLEDVVRVTEDLSDCRNRLEAGIQENRRNRQVIQEINDQLQKFRQKAHAESIDSIPHNNSLGINSLNYLGEPININQHQNISMPSLTIDIPLNTNTTNHSSRFYGNNSETQNQYNYNRHKSLGFNPEEGSGSHRFRSSSPIGRHRSSPRLFGNLNFDDENIDELFAKLKEEMFRNNTLEEVNEMLREENDAALAANEHLQIDTSNLTKQLQILQQQQHSEGMRFRSENTRYRNQVETQHRKLISLWKEFTAVKRQLHDLRTSTANDLDRQLTEFTRCAALMRKAIRSSEQKNIEMKEQMKKENDDVLDETLRQLNSATENYMKSEEKANERQRELKRKDDELRKLKEQNDEYVEILEQLSKMTYEMTNNRARSQSPILNRLSYKENPMDVARKMRKLLKSKNGEIDESREAAHQAEKDRDRIKKELEKEEKRRRDDRESERKRSSVYSQREQELKKLEADLKKSQDKIRNLEEQRENQDKLIKSVQNSLSDAHRQHKEFIEELMIRHRLELKEREEAHEEQIRFKNNEEKLRLEKERNEKDRLKKDHDETRETLRNIKADLITVQTDLEDKTMKMITIENERDELKKKLDNEREQLDQREIEITEYRSKLEEIQEKETELRSKLAEAESSVSAMEEQYKQSNEECAEIKNEISDLTQQLDSLTLDLDEKREEIQNLKKQIHEKDEIVRSIKSSSHQLTATYEEANGEIEILKNEIKRLHDQLNDRTHQIAEKNGKYDEICHKNEILAEDLSICQIKCEDFKKEIEEMERKRLEKEKDENELKSLLDDLRSNFDKLTNDLKQQTITIDSFNVENSSLKEKLTRLEKDRKEDILRLEEAEKRAEMELKEEYEGKIKFIEKEKSSAEKFSRETESRLNELTKIHEMLMEENDQLKVDLVHTKEEADKLREKLRREIEKANEQNENDRIEWRDERTRIETLKNNQIQEMQDKINNLNDLLKEKDEKQIQLKKEIEDSMELNQNLEEKLKKLTETIEEKEEDWINEKKKLTEEKVKLLEEKEEAMLKATKNATNLDQNSRKIQNFESEIDKLNSFIIEKESSINALEENTKELIIKIEQIEKESEKMKDEIAILTKQNNELKSGKDELNEKLNEEKKKNQESSDQLREINKNLHNLRMKNVNLEEKRIELEQNCTILENKIRQLEIQLMDKSAKNEVSGDLLKKMEHDTQSMIKQAQTEQNRLSELEKTRRILQEENDRLAGDLSTVKAAFEAKRESSKSAIGDILVQYRKSEERANEMAIENQKLKSELAAFNTKLERLDTKLKEAETKSKENQHRFEESQLRLANLQRSAVESLQYELKPSRPNRSLYIDIPRAASSIGLNEGIDDSRRTPSVRFADSNQSVQRAVDSMDVSSSVGVTLRFLKERIEQLEMDKAELLEALDKIKDNLREKDEKVSEKQRIIEQIERQLIHITEEKNTIEHRMTSQRQMYLTNEESGRSREHEIRSMKARISSLELHLRDKEAKIIHLKKEIEILHSQLHDAIESKEKLSVLFGGNESKYRDLEDLLDRTIREKDAALIKVRRMTAEIENNCRKLEQYEREREQLMREITDERKINEKNRLLIEEMKRNERSWKNAMTNAKKSAEEVERNNIEQKRWEDTHHELTTRNLTLSKECDRLRSEMREQINRMNINNLKTVDYERKNDELSSKLLVLQNNVDVLKKFEEEWKRLEAEMRTELKILRKDKLIQTAEIEELRRKCLRNESEKKEIEGIRVRLERELSALKRHVDALEDDKTKTEKAVRDTINERKAIDKSLAAMEKENQQLYRNCAQLQAQIQQLEKDAGNRSVAKLAKEHTLLEARISALIEEKRQLRAMLDQKEANYSHKRKLLESQIQLLREQLDAERRKRAKNGTLATGPTARRIAQNNTSAFRRTIEHRSISCERIILEQKFQQFNYLSNQTGKIAKNIQTPQMSPLSHSSSYTSGTLIM